MLLRRKSSRARVDYVQVLMRGPNVPDPRNPDTIRKSHSTVALTRQAIHDGSVPRLVPRSTGKGARPHDASAPVADIKVDAPGETPLLQIPAQYTMLINAFITHWQVHAGSLAGKLTLLV